MHKLFHIPTSGSKNSSNGGHVSVVNLRGLKFFFLEPIGSSVPKFSNDDKSDTFFYGMNHPIAMLCLAQAFPVPSFRYNLQLKGYTFI